MDRYELAKKLKNYREQNNIKCCCNCKHASVGYEDIVCTIKTDYRKSEYFYCEATDICDDFKVK
jgi:hypothetical protein